MANHFKSISLKEPFMVRVSFGRSSCHSGVVMCYYYTYRFDNFIAFDRMVQEVSRHRVDSLGYYQYITMTSTPDMPRVRWSRSTGRPLGFGKKDYKGYYSDRDMLIDGSLELF